MTTSTLERLAELNEIADEDDGVLSEFRDALVNFYRSDAFSEMVKNDARYRWLSGIRWYIQVMSDVMDRFPKFCVIGTELNAAIDAAMSEDTRRDHG